MITYKAMFAGSSAVEYSFDAAKAWVAQTAGRTLRWSEGADGRVWFGYRTNAERSAGGAKGHGSIARIVDHTHPDF